MNPGTYTLLHSASRRYLSHSGRDLTLGSVPTAWTLRPAGKMGFYVCAHGTELLLDIHNAWVSAGNTVKIWEHTGYDVQIWTIEKNPNGSHSILHSADRRYCLGIAGGRAVLQLRDRGNPGQEWTLAPAGGAAKEYLTVFSSGRVIELQLPTDIHRIIPSVRLQRWADQLETAYGAFDDLIGWRPFDTIIVEAWNTAPHPGYAGWVYPKQNVIHIDRDFLRKDLAKMNARTSDWNFCALHEMGHMFDFGKPWNFEPELMTDLKVAYVMEKVNASAAPSEFEARVCFHGADIARAYGRLGRDFSRDYDIYGCAKRFLEIKDRIGWAPFRMTFHHLQQFGRIYAQISGQERFLLFMKTLSRFSGQDLQSRFSAGEWNAILRKSGGNAV